MSKKDRARAAIGSVFRSGQLVDKDAYADTQKNGKIIREFMTARRQKYDPKKYIVPACPECSGDKVRMARRPLGKFECICLHCYHVWFTVPKEREAPEPVSEEVIKEEFDRGHRRTGAGVKSKKGGSPGTGQGNKRNRGKVHGQPPG